MTTKNTLLDMSSDISGTIELDLTIKHNLIIQPIASPTGQQIELSGTIPLQTFPATLIKLDLNENKAIISLIASPKEANIEMIRTPLTDGIFNAVIEKIQYSSDTDKDSLTMLLQILRDSLTPDAHNQDLIEKLKQISHIPTIPILSQSDSNYRIQCSLNM
jgi:hypothetical protein